MKELFVKLRHQPLPQHEIESRAGSTTLSYKEQKRFMKFAHLSKDHYTPEEDEIIKTNWNDFCKVSLQLGNIFRVQCQLRESYPLFSFLTRYFCFMLRSLQQRAILLVESRQP